LTTPSGENLQAKIARYEADMEDIDAHITAIQNMSSDGLLSESFAEEECAKWAGIKDMIEELVNQLKGGM
jgi:hypothetical protein